MNAALNVLPSLLPRILPRVLPRVVLCACVTATAPACSKSPGQSAEFFVFGTLVDVRLPDSDREQAAEVLPAVQRELQRMHHEWHAWEPGALTRLNDALQTGETARTTAEIAEMLRRSRDLERRSGGRFNPAIGRLVALWGFHTSEFPIVGPPPDGDAIGALVDARPSTLDLVLEGDTVRSSNPAVQLDFGGIGKGYATDLACAVIRSQGVESAIVNAGGDVRTMGDNAGKPWRIAVRDPAGAGGVAGAIEISGDAAVFTSGNYARFREDAGERYAHILDPRTGYPVRHVASATVIAPDGTTADAAATAMVVAGPEDWPQVAADMGIAAVLVIDASGEMRATRAMMDYFTPAEGWAISVVGPER